MKRASTGKALILSGLVAFGVLVIDSLGGIYFPTTQLFYFYALIVLVFGAGIHREQIQFDPNTGWYYEGLSLLMAFLVIVSVGFTILLNLVIS